MYFNNLVPTKGAILVKCNPFTGYFLIYFGPIMDKKAPIRNSGGVLGVRAAQFA